VRWAVLELFADSEFLTTKGGCWSSATSGFVAFLLNSLLRQECNVCSSAFFRMSQQQRITSARSQSGTSEYDLAASHHTSTRSEGTFQTTRSVSRV
jgi:hypothetical protein